MPMSKSSKVLHSRNPFSLLITHSKFYFYSDFYAKHYVFAPVPALKNVAADHLTEGVRVYVTGAIRYLNFQSAEGHSKQNGQILSTNVFLSEQNDDPSSGSSSRFR